MRNDFAIFILSHGRAGNVITVKTLEQCGYTGKWFVVIDDEDSQENLYRKIYGDRVLQFSKIDIARTFDTMDLSQDRRTIVYARNACFQLANQVGVNYFLELDDDYKSFEYRYVLGNKLMVEKVSRLDDVVDSYIDFLDETDASSVAFAQGGDFIGGSDSSQFNKKVLRKAMNAFFCCVDRPFKFSGRINEDVNTYVGLGQVGKKFFTAVDISLVQTPTQKSKGGMSTVYLDGGTFLKSFYTVMMAPSCVKIAEMGNNHKRIHHAIEWENAVPKIISDRFRK